MTLMTRRRFAAVFCAAAFVASPLPLRAQSPQMIADDATRYLALGDSIAAGYKAVPVTRGYAYRLYEKGVFDEVRHTLFANASVPGASSQHLLRHQVPQALIPAADGGFIPDYITVTIGGNDLLSILHFMQTNPTPGALNTFATNVISAYGVNLWTAVYQLHAALPNARIYVGNQYSVPTIEALVPLATPLIAALNETMRQVLAQFETNVYLVDVHAALAGQPRLLLADRRGVSPFETHLTSAGHRAMANAFADAIARSR